MARRDFKCVAWTNKDLPAIRRVDNHATGSYVPDMVL